MFHFQLAVLLSYGKIKDLIIFCQTYNNQLWCFADWEAELGGLAAEGVPELDRFPGRLAKHDRHLE
jgi:hypothetical protein